jgi:hypothetical protein
MLPENGVTGKWGPFERVVSYPGMCPADTHRSVPESPQRINSEEDRAGLAIRQGQVSALLRAES